MSSEILLQRLKSATSPEQKAALVSEAILQDFPSKLAKIALWCGFLPWFSDDVLRNLLNGDDDNVQRILDLPFVEKLSIGYCFHTATRRGLLQKYRTENPSEIVAAFQAIPAMVDEISDQSVQDIIGTLYGYVITNQGLNAEKLLIKMLERGKIQDIEMFSEIDEAEEFCVAENIGMTPKYWSYRSQIFVLLDNLDMAIVCCNKALILDPNYYQAYSFRCLIQARKRNFSEAFSDANLAIKLKPDELTFRCRGKVNMLYGDYKKSIFDFTRAIRYNPKDIDSYLGRSNAYLAIYKPEKAFLELDKALEFSDTEQVKSYIYFNYARTKILMAEWESALDYLNKSIEIEPSSGAYRRKGDLLLKLTKFEESYESYQLALSFDEDNPYIYLGLGKLHLYKEMYTEAIRDFTRATLLKNTLNIIPHNALGAKEVNLRLWEVYIREGNTEKANEQKNILIASDEIAQLYEIQFFCRKYQLFDDLLDVNIKLSKIDNKKTLFSSLVTGYALNLVGRYADALICLRDTEKLSVSNAIWKVNAGISYWGLNDFQRAGKYFEEVNHLLLTKKPNSNNFRSRQTGDSMFSSEHVWVNVMLGNSKKAIQIMDEYLQGKDVNVDEFYDLRDWSLIVKRFPENLPIEFDHFWEYLVRVLTEKDKELIYQFSWGI